MGQSFSIQIEKTRYKIFSFCLFGMTFALFIATIGLKGTDAFWGGMIFVVLCLAFGICTLLQSTGRSNIRVDHNGLCLPGIKLAVAYPQIIKVWSYSDSKNGWGLLGAAYDAFFGETLVLVFEMRRPSLLKNLRNYFFRENNMYEVSCGRADDLEIELEEFYAAIGKYSNGSVGIPIPLEWKVPQ